TKTANRILTGFATLTRQHLELSRRSVANLQEELVYLQHYLALEKLRIPDKMNYRIEVSEEIDTENILIPSMLIQPFLENAIWHGIMPKEKGGFIRLSIALDTNHLAVSITDDGVGITNSKKLRDHGNSNHISRGISLIKQRINLLNKLRS